MYLKTCQTSRTSRASRTNLTSIDQQIFHIIGMYVVFKKILEKNHQKRNMLCLKHKLVNFKIPVLENSVGASAIPQPFLNPEVAALIYKRFL